MDIFGPYKIPRIPNVCFVCSSKVFQKPQRDSKGTHDTKLTPLSQTLYFVISDIELDPKTCWSDLYFYEILIPPHFLLNYFE